MYDKDLIDACYHLQQIDRGLAERIFERLTKKAVEPTEQKGFMMTSGRWVMPETIEFVKQRVAHSGQHPSLNKVSAIKAFREHTGMGLKESKDSIDEMLEAGILN